MTNIHQKGKAKGLQKKAVSLPRSLESSLPSEGPTRDFADRASSPSGLLLYVAFILVLAAVTFERNYVWHDPMRLWEDVIKKSPNKARSYANLARVCESNGLIDRAVGYYQAALSLDPDYAEVHNNLGIIYRRQGQLDKAAGHLQTALRLNPDYVAYNNLGNIYFSQGLIASSIEQYRTSLRLYPDFVEAHINLGVAYETAGLLNNAMGEYLTALRLRPGDDIARGKLDAILQLKGKYLN
jgi:tetratricopeptide (TPR) repeat protein